MTVGLEDALLAEVLHGLRQPQKTLPPKLFYDEAGSALFERITRLPEYYPTRTEASILSERGGEIAEVIRGDRGTVMIEPGAGGSTKAASILSHLRGAVYLAIDIDGGALASGAAALRALLPDTRISTLVADYTRQFALPALPPGRRAVFFPGSTIGNFDRPEAREFLGRLRLMAGDGGTVVVGVDLWKDPEILRRAYDDAQGVTAAFDKNALAHLNRRFGADFDLGRFQHFSRVDPDLRRVEMHLRSIGRQRVHLGGEVVRFEDGETIHTENACKYTRAGFVELGRSAGLEPIAHWTDARGRYLVTAFAPLE